MYSMSSRPPWGKDVVMPVQKETGAVAPHQPVHLSLLAQVGHACSSAAIRTGNSGRRIPGSPSHKMVADNELVAPPGQPQYFGEPAQLRITQSPESDLPQVFGPLRNS